MIGIGTADSQLKLSDMHNITDDEDFDFVDFETVKNNSVDIERDEHYNFVEINPSEVKNELFSDNVKFEVIDGFEKNIAPMKRKEGNPDSLDVKIKDKKGRRSFPQDEFLSCDECDLKTPYLSNLKKHKKYVHEKIRFLCEICNRDFSDIKSHMDVVHAKVKGLKCDMCEYSCVKTTRLKYHKELVHFRQHLKQACPQCFVICSDLDHLDGHIERVHNKPMLSLAQSNEPSFSCEECEFTSRSNSSLRSHIRSTHLKEWINCSVCDKRIIKWSISVHMRKHIDKRFKCNPCDKTYREKRDLSKHILYAHKNFRHQCKICYKDVPNIWQHMKFMHKTEANKELIDRHEEDELFKEIKMKLGVNQVYDAEF